MFRFIILFLALLNVAAFAPGLGVSHATTVPSSVVMMAKAKPGKGKVNPALFKTGLEGKKPVKKAQEKLKDKDVRFDGSFVFPRPWEAKGKDAFR